MKCSIERKYLVGAGLAVFEGVLGREIVLPKADIPSLPVTFVIVEPLPTERRDGRVELPLGVVVPPRRRCGMRDGVASSVQWINFRLVDFEYANRFRWQIKLTSAVEGKRWAMSWWWFGAGATSWSWVWLWSTRCQSRTTRCVRWFPRSVASSAQAALVIAQRIGRWRGQRWTRWTWHRNWTCWTLSNLSDRFFFFFETAKENQNILISQRRWWKRNSNARAISTSTISWKSLIIEY